ncbi:transposase [Kitasatospora sp. NPDC004240]
MSGRRCPAGPGGGRPGTAASPVRAGTGSAPGRTRRSAGVSSRRTRQEFPDPVEHHRRAQRLRSGPYVAGSVGGAPLSMVRRYIEQQNRPA